MEDSRERLSSVNSQNEVLHSHIQNLTDQMEAEEAKRRKEDRDVADRVQGDGEGWGWVMLNFVDSVFVLVLFFGGVGYGLSWSDLFFFFFFAAVFVVLHFRCFRFFFNGMFTLFCFSFLSNIFFFAPVCFCCSVRFICLFIYRGESFFFVLHTGSGMYTQARLVLPPP